MLHKKGLHIPEEEGLDLDSIISFHSWHKLDKRK
jgi:hypothetical protein